MKRGIVIGLLVGGVVVGLSVGFCRLGHARWEKRDEFHDRIAETCSEATLRVLEREHGSRHHDRDRDGDGDRGGRFHDFPRSDRPHADFAPPPPPPPAAAPPAPPQAPAAKP
jgi:hypothetical protein